MNPLSAASNEQATTSTSHQRPQATEPPAPQFITAEQAAQVYKQATHEYVQAATMRTQEYEQASRAFQADKELAPFFPLAVAHFQELESMSPNAPVKQLFDRTLKHVRQLKSMGIQPPPAPRRQNGFVNSTDSAYMPGMELEGEQPRQGGFSKENPHDKMRRNQEYLLERRIDLEQRKSKSTNLDAEKIVNDQLRAAINRGAIERVAGV